MKPWFEVTQQAPGVWSISEAGIVHSYLITGNEQALLIDTGLGLGDIRAEVERLIDLPIIVVNTHAHWDHVGGNHRFSHIVCHRAEVDQLLHAQIPDRVRAAWQAGQSTFDRPLPNGIDLRHFDLPPSPEPIPIEQGAAIDLGQRVLQVLHTPGHSPGSICLFDERERLLFTGDSVGASRILLHLPGSDPMAYRESIRMLKALAWEINLLFPGHGPTPVEGHLLLEIDEGLERAMSGDLPGELTESPWGNARHIRLERVEFLLPPAT